MLEIHRRARIQHHGAAKVRLLFVLFHIIALGLAHHFPVHVPQIIARVVGPMLRELHAEPVKRTLMQAGDEALDNLPGFHLERGEVVIVVLEITRNR
jgi:hypothetical protein